MKSQILSPHIKAPDKAAPGVEDSSIRISSGVLFLWKGVECFAKYHDIIIS